MNLQGVCPQYLEGDVSLCEEWAGVFLQISENDNYVIKAINLENQDGTTWKGLTQALTPESWKGAHIMTEPQDSQGPYERIHVEQKNCMDALSVMTASVRHHVKMVVPKNVKQRSPVDALTVGNT